MSFNPRLQKTRDYAQFISSKANRTLEAESFRPQHERLKESMRKFGFLPSFPLTVRRVNGKLQVEDGQHRLHFARLLGLDVYYVVIDNEIDVAEINQAQASWKVKDYVNRWAQSGIKDYAKASEFASTYMIPIGEALSLLTLNSTFGNIAKKVKDGTWKITNLLKATEIAEIYKSIYGCSGVARHNNLFRAIYACSFVDGFDPKRLTESIERRANSWVNGGHWRDYLTQIEEFYNFGKKTKVPLKFDAQEAMRLRNAAK